MSDRRRLEKLLYPSITALLEGRGLTVWEEATIRAGDRGTRTADHLAWDWKGDQLNLQAVEAKAGETLVDAAVALAQATAYQVGIPRVYVAAEGPLAEFGYLAGVLKYLRLGYVRVAFDRRRATVESDPEASPFLVEDVHAENIARARLKHLFTQDVIGEPAIVGRDRRGDLWAVTGTTKQWQLCAQVVAGEGVTWLSLLAESTELGKRVAEPSKADALAELLANADSDGQLVLREREHRGFQPKYSDIEETWRPSDGQKPLNRLLVAATALGGTRRGPHFEFRVGLWRHSERLTEAEARRQLRAATERLRAVRSALDALYVR